jgi:hypothetical protein
MIRNPKVQSTNHIAVNLYLLMEEHTTTGFILAQETPQVV